MTIREAIMEGAGFLRERGSESPFLDASLLLSQALSVSKDALLSRYPEALAPEAALPFRSLLARRESGEPMAYIAGRKEFRGLDFHVDPRVLVPRPETEHLVEAALRAAAVLARAPGPRKKLRLHDCCAGSGCVGVCLASELPAALPGLEFEVSLSDISAEALAVASLNAESILGHGLETYQGDLLSPLSEPGYSIIVSNPPYLTGAEMESVRARGQGEPELALYGGEDGLEAYRRLAPQALPLLAAGGFLIVEMGAGQGDALRSILADSGYSEIFVERDLAGLDRVAGGRKRG
jgi:release factor glutamine methyltransferase